MRPLHPRSFRRLLIFRLLLLGIPILLIGQYITLRKARTGLLETARQNLTNSAIHKAEFLQQNSDILVRKTQLLAQAHPLQGDDLADIESVFSQFTLQTPLSTTCAQLLDAKTLAVLVSTCSQPTPIPEVTFPQSIAQSSPTPFSLVAITSKPVDAPKNNRPNRHAQVEMTWAAPVYTANQALKSIVVFQAQLSQLENINARSLVGYTVVLDESGTFAIHPDPGLEGQPISALRESDRFQSILRNAQSGRQATLHLFNFLPSYHEWLAGYSKLNLQVAPEESQQWTVLAVTPLDHALQGLADIRNVLILLTLGLLTTQVLLVLYLAQRLSMPIERLCQFAHEIQDLSHFKEVPQNFQVWELNHLARVFNGMMKRLEQKVHELHHAWQESQLANQLKSQFLANTSHELRTPLNAIIGCIRLVRDGCCDSEEETQEFLDTADQAAVHLLGIINDILDIAKIESGTLEVNLATLDTRQVVEDVVNLQALQFQQKGLTLCCHQSDEPLWVMADPAKLKQVVLNIVYNAIKFTERGEITINTHLELEKTADSAIPWPADVNLPTPFPRVVVSVSDTGIGIAPSQQEKLFQPFVMADGSTTRQYEGTGLGLAISRNLMTLMGGSITLHSGGIGYGTQVLFSLPLANPSVPSSESPETNTDEPADTTQSNSTQERSQPVETIPRSM